MSDAEKIIALFNAGVISRDDVREALGLEPEDPISLRDRVGIVRRAVVGVRRLRVGRHTAGPAQLLELRPSSFQKINFN